MSKPKTAAELRALEPRYTIGGLFQSGVLGPADETAIEEINAVRLSFQRYVNPSRGWLTPRFSDARPEMPRQMGNAPSWRRYKAWRHRWSRQIVAPSASIPWGLTVADVVTLLVTEPVTFNDTAPLTGMSALGLVELFSRCVRDYGVEMSQAWNGARSARDGRDAATMDRLWRDRDPELYKSAKILSPEQRKRMEQTRNRVRKHRTRTKQRA